MDLREMIIRELHKATPKQLRLIYKWSGGSCEENKKREGMSPPFSLLVRFILRVVLRLFQDFGGGFKRLPPVVVQSGEYRQQLFREVVVAAPEQRLAYEVRDLLVTCWRLEHFAFTGFKPDRVDII